MLLNKNSKQQAKPCTDRRQFCTVFVNFPTNGKQLNCSKTSARDDPKEQTKTVVRTDIFSVQNATELRTTFSLALNMTVLFTRHIFNIDWFVMSRCWVGTTYAVFISTSKDSKEPRERVWWLQVSFFPPRWGLTALPKSQLDLRGHFAEREREGEWRGRKETEGMRVKHPR